MSGLSSQLSKTYRTAVDSRSPGLCAVLLLEIARCLKLEGKTRYFSALRVRMNSTNCQRCSSGNRLNDGMPLAAFPLVMRQNSAPSLCDCTAGNRKSAECFSAIPLPSLPWHSVQFRMKSFLPPATAVGFSAKGFFFAAACGGAFQLGSVL